MALTFEVNKDKSVTIYNEGTVFAHQFDDPDVEGYDAFASKARAEEWAKKAIARYEAELDAAKKASEEANAVAEAELKRQEEILKAEDEAFAASAAKADAKADAK
jgi:hypothetical protein